MSKNNRIPFLIPLIILLLVGCGGQTEAEPAAAVEPTAAAPTALPPTAQLAAATQNQSAGEKSLAKVREELESTRKKVQELEHSQSAGRQETEQLSAAHVSAKRELEEALKKSAGVQNEMKSAEEKHQAAIKAVTDKYEQERQAATAAVRLSSPLNLCENCRFVLLMLLMTVGLIRATQAEKERAAFLAQIAEKESQVRE